MGRTACTEPQCLYKGALYFTLLYFTLLIDCRMVIRFYTLRKDRYSYEMHTLRNLERMSIIKVAVIYMKILNSP